MCHTCSLCKCVRKEHRLKGKSIWVLRVESRSLISRNDAISVGILILLKLWIVFTFELLYWNTWIEFNFHYVGKLFWIQGLDWEFCNHPEAGGGRKALCWLQLSQCASTMVTNSAFKNFGSVGKRWSKVTRFFSVSNNLKYSNSLHLID